MQKAEKNILL